MGNLIFSKDLCRRSGLILLCGIFFSLSPIYGQQSSPSKKVTLSSKKRTIYGMSSFYADKFEGRRTANGEIFRQTKLTCACNMVPFGTWLKVTNVRNKKSVLVRVNDRLHKSMRRVTDLTKMSAKKLGCSPNGLVRVKVEVLGKRKPE